MTGDRRVVVTGIGTVTPFGCGVDNFRTGLREGRVATSEIDMVDVSDFPRSRGGEVKDFTHNGETGRAAAMATHAARLALRDARLPIHARQGAGSVFGTTNGQSDLIEKLGALWVDVGLDAMSDEHARSLPTGSIASTVAVELGLTGEAQTFATACSASNYAIGYGRDQIAFGDADVMLVGGADAFNRWGHAGFNRLGALAEESCRPFDAERDGMLTSEGAVCLVLEALETATERGARIYAEVRGYGTSCDAYHPTAPDAASIARCIDTALINSGVTASDVDYICAHGTGTPTNDKTEVAAVRSAYGDVQVPPMSSIKSMIGHTMGAASGLGAAACCLAIADGFLPPTAGLSTVDPVLGPDFDPVAVTSRPADVKVAQNNGFAFGGNNAITIFAECAA